MLVTACGGSAEDAAAPPAEVAQQSLPSVESTVPASDATDSAPTDTPVTDPAPIDTATPESAPTVAPVETDAAVTPPAPVGGRVLASELDPAADFDANPFPNLVVDDVGRGGQANLANLLPTDRPVLVWAWAPH
jgi:hypothetical protein